MSAPLSGPETPGRVWARLAAALARAGAITRRIIGVPDYERYVTHMRACHPAQTPLGPDEFIAQRLTDRYSRPGSRCC